MTGPNPHRTQVVDLGEGLMQSVCTCGWRSDRFGANKREGTMDALQHATDAGDLHEWESSLGER